MLTLPRDISNLRIPCRKLIEVGFFKVDVDEQSEITEEVGVRAMPTFIAFKNGEKI